jgi:hypothetical protein
VVAVSLPKPQTPNPIQLLFRANRLRNLFRKIA